MISDVASESVVTSCIAMFVFCTRTIMEAASGARPTAVDSIVLDGEAAGLAILKTYTWVQEPGFWQ